MIYTSLPPQEDFTALLKLSEIEKAVDYVTKSRLNKFQKNLLRRAWLNANKKFTMKDWERARNRHPHYKRLKRGMASQLRNSNRRKKHDYKKVSGKKVWPRKELSLFLKINETSTDITLARHFHTTIASVQGVRRKINLAAKIVADHLPKMSILELIMSSEQTLRKIVKEATRGNTKSEEQILAKLKEVKGGDMFGFKVEVLLQFLPAKIVQELFGFKNPEEDMKKWEEEDREDLTEENVMKLFREYMEFAWGKAADHRGLSAGRSVEKLTMYAWIMGADELVKDIEDERIEYAQYGCPILAAIATKFSLPIPTSSDIQNMIAGRPCEPDCTMGCGS